MRPNSYKIASIQRSLSNKKNVQILGTLIVQFKAFQFTCIIWGFDICSIIITISMTNVPSARGYNQSDEEEENNWGYRDRGLDNTFQADDVEERGFEPRQQPEDDIFVFKNTDLPGVPKTEKIRRLIVSEETKVLVTESNRLYRWRSKVDAEFKSYELPEIKGQTFLGLLSTKEKASGIKNVFLDQKGWHCFIVGDGGNNYYLNYRDSKPKVLRDLKGANVRVVAFHGSSNETRSGDIIIGLDGGTLILYRVDLQQNGQIREQAVLQHQLYLTHQISSCEILRLTQKNGNRYVIVLISTVGSIVCMTGPDDLEPLINSYKNQSQKIREVPLPKGYQCLTHICNSKIMKRPTTLLWTNGTTLLSFKLPEAQDSINDLFLSSSKSVQKLKFAKQKDLPEGKTNIQDHPLAVGITDFHYYLLFQDGITILSTITKKVILYQEFKGSLVSDMAYDRASSTFWIFSNKGVIKLDTSQEGTQAWKLLLEERKYEQAYVVCKAKNENLSYAAGLYAQDLFAKRDYEKAAKYFSQTERTFQQIFLKFLQVNSNEARNGLEIYLKAWLNKLSPADKSQRCLLVSWLIELMVYRLNRLQREGSPGAREKQKQLEELLAAHSGSVNEQLVYLIMQSHGRIRDLISFADRKNNFEMIVMHYLSEQAYEKALEYLRNVKDARVVDVVYKYSHIFFRYETEKTVSLLTKSIREFKPIKLMPGLMNIPDPKRIHGIQLLRYCVEELRSREKSLHNILIFFYATSPKQKIPELIDLMKKGRLDFDLDFGLRLFKTYKMVEAQIIVYGKMYLYGEAVALALQHNKQDLAKEYADKPQYEDQRKKLWIEIAKNFLVKKGRISDVIELTKQSKVVKIQDLLPYFNQNIKIQSFKDQICQSLKSYSTEIGRLKQLMDSYSTNAEQLKNELRMVKNRCIEIDSSHKCEECLKTLFSQQFYIFPCMHGFHRICLQSATSAHPSLNARKLRQVEALSQDIKALEERIMRKKQQKTNTKQAPGGFSFMNALNIWSNKREDETSSLSLQKEQSELRSKKNEIDNILAAECLYCGPGIVDTIIMPFDNQILRESWKI